MSNLHKLFIFPTYCLQENQLIFTPDNLMESVGKRHRKGKAGWFDDSRLGRDIVDVRGIGYAQCPSVESF